MGRLLKFTSVCWCSKALCPALCKFPPNYKVCTHREASLCLFPVPSGLCLSVCEVGGFMWPPCCCTILVHVAWAESHTGWVWCCEPQPLSSVAFAWKGGAQHGPAPSRVPIQLPSRPGSSQTVWVLLGRQLKYLNSYFIFCSPVSTCIFFVLHPVYSQLCPYKIAYDSLLGLTYCSFL